eukprot:gnl/TRDRNA2_/TRDRNA2_147169_c1_seq1.p2 gnl/TRDRNA2_/TRDRNA2_147169_c1~~gnl/TRDRNA2_/TRDRNA2_147169_c1_seq1.p2  ORF type:complete len:109 (+),score=11.39 gnl/TRDRNA2_/TRDRNA2_147169_c1_seq1:27-353(+)
MPICISAYCYTSHLSTASPCIVLSSKSTPARDQDDACTETPLVSSGASQHSLIVQRVPLQYVAGTGGKFFILNGDSQKMGVHLSLSPQHSDAKQKLPSQNSGKTCLGA